ncbi:CsiV family protein [Marinobacter lipolyticus]|uniref:CsiV family protein n=1 Tax=Marinobacter lipolyticus TaxID=209639 RepID=UPI001D189952|nr:CsiV family protein [Marinobacter lipolyticus]
MRTPGYALPGKALTTLTAALLAVAPLFASAQEQRDNYYRAEIVLVERLVDPEAVTERMASRVPATDEDVTARMKVEREDGSTDTTLQLVPDSELHLRSAAQRLQNSGRFRVLMSAGWYQSFPPDYDGEPMKVAVGDWLAEAGHREVEGHITIDRQRYLHVGVHLNHWQPGEPVDVPLQDVGNVINDDTVATSDTENPDDGSIGSLAQGGDIGADSVSSPEPRAKAELLTWIRETRRMRSEEVHFLDSPTIGVLVFFKRVEN